MQFFHAFGQIFIGVKWPNFEKYFSGHTGLGPRVLHTQFKVKILEEQD